VELPVLPEAKMEMRIEMPLPSAKLKLAQDHGKGAERRQRKNAACAKTRRRRVQSGAQESRMPNFAEYMAQYDHEHTNPWNKVLHGIGIPIIIAGIVLGCFRFWRTGAALFVGGWILLFVGHRVEGNKPAFFQGVIYFLVGPVWIAKEIKDGLLGRSTAHGPRS
jgi:hypothetical protein